MFHPLILILVFSLVLPSWAESRQENRFQKPIQDLQHSLNKKNPEEVLEQLIQKTNRSDLFELEALLRVYEKEYPETLSGFLEKYIKPFEDELGKWTDTREAMAFSERVGAPKEVLAYLKGKEEAAKEQFSKFLYDHNFLGKAGKASKTSPFRELQKALEETDWSGKKKDRKLVLKETIKLLKEVAESDYDLKLLEEGVHELRRDLRWVPIYLRSFNDLFKLDKRNMSQVKIDSQDPILKSPYSKLPRARDPVSFPILFPRLGFLAVNKVIEDLGKAKDMGKMEALLAHALRQTGVASSGTQAKTLAKSLVKKHPDYIPVTQKALALYRALIHEERGLISALKPLLKEQKDWKKKDCQSFLKDLNSK